MRGVIPALSFLCSRCSPIQIPTRLQTAKQLACGASKSFRPSAPPAVHQLALSGAEEAPT
eukprot:631756-Amphidinium_carterae.2